MSVPRRWSCMVSAEPSRRSLSSTPRARRAFPPPGIQMRTTPTLSTAASRARQVNAAAGLASVPCAAHCRSARRQRLCLFGLLHPCLREIEQQLELEVVRRSGKKQRQYCKSYASLRHVACAAAGLAAAGLAECSCRVSCPTIMVEVEGEEAVVSVRDLQQRCTPASL